MLKPRRNASVRTKNLITDLQRRVDMRLLQPVSPLIFAESDSEGYDVVPLSSICVVYQKVLSMKGSSLDRTGDFVLSLSMDKPRTGGGQKP